MYPEYKKLNRVRDLQIGQIVKNVPDGIPYIVVGVYGERATAVRTADITNAIEWEVLTEN